MSITQLTDQIEAFWLWFARNRFAIENVVAGDPIQRDYVVQGLDQHILGMGKIKWEVENPDSNLFCLTLSPNSSRDLLKITKAIIAEAPVLENWVFHHAKPANNQYFVRLYDSEMDVVEVDASLWEYVSLPDDGRYELLIHPVGSDDMDEDTLAIATDLILTGILGEENKINCLSGFELVDFFLEKHQNRINPISHLITLC